MTSNLRAALEPLVSRVRTDVTATKTAAGRMIWTREALTEAGLEQHLNDGRPRGVCPIKAGESTTRIAVFDLDNHKGEVLWETMLQRADSLCAALEAKGYWPVAFRSSGGNGIHVFIIWDEDQDAYSVRQEMDHGILRPLGFKNGTKGVAGQEIEIFPKQDSVPLESFGSQFILPLHNRSAPLDNLTGSLEVMPREYAAQLKWNASTPVPVVEKPVRKLATATGDLAVLQEQLGHLDTDGMGRDDWRNVVFGIGFESGGSEEGFQLADDFSARFDSYDYEELRKMWDAADHSKAGGITGRTIRMMAGQGGWQEPPLPAEAFDIVPVPAGERLRPNFKVDGKSRIEATVGNIELALDRPDICGMELRYDEFRDEIVFGGDGAWQAFGDRHYTALRLDLEAMGFKPIGREMMRDMVHYVAMEKPIDTAVVWANALVWDGVPRVLAFLESRFNVPPSAYASAVSRYWWTAMAGRVLSPGCQADMVPILISPEQGFRKSSSIRAMVPGKMHRQISFTQSETERARLLRGCLAAELAELQGLRTRELEEIKAWVTRRDEEWVPKYKEFAVTIPRRCVFVGTTNSTELFDDPTGERRWLPVRVGVVDVEGIVADRDQLWAEAVAMWKAKGVAWQDAEQLAQAEHVNYRVTDTWEEALTVWASADSILGAAPSSAGFTTREALIEGLGFSDKSIKKGDEMRASKVLQHAGFRRKSEWRGGRTAWVWRRQMISHDRV